MTNDDNRIVNSHRGFCHKPARVGWFRACNISSDITVHSKYTLFGILLLQTYDINKIILVVLYIICANNITGGRRIISSPCLRCHFYRFRFIAVLESFFLRKGRKSRSCAKYRSQGHYSWQKFGGSLPQIAHHYLGIPLNFHRNSLA